MAKKKKPAKVKERELCPHCHQPVSQSGEHYSFLSYRYRCGDQWVGNDI